jgi:hypothetical protein
MALAEAVRVLLELPQMLLVQLRVMAVLALLLLHQAHRLLMQAEAAEGNTAPKRLGRELQQQVAEQVEQVAAQVQSVLRER